MENESIIRSCSVQETAFVTDDLNVVPVQALIGEPGSPDGLIGFSGRT